MRIDSRIQFRSQQNISETSQQNGVAAFSLDKNLMRWGVVLKYKRKENLERNIKWHHTAHLVRPKSPEDPKLIWKHYLHPFYEASLKRTSWITPDMLYVVPILELFRRMLQRSRNVWCATKLHSSFRWCEGQYFNFISKSTNTAMQL